AEDLAELIEAERERWPEETLVEHTLELAHTLRHRLSRTEDAVDRLVLLVRQHPSHRAAHEALIDGLEALERWQPAIEAMRTAWTALGDAPLHYAHLARTAEIYERELGLPDRALGPLQELAEAPEDELPQGLLDQVLATQQRLYDS